MIPLSDSTPTAHAPAVNRLLLLANIAAWIYTVTLVGQPEALAAFYDRYAFDWSELVRLMSEGQLGAATFAPLLTHLFLHGGWLHVGGNVLYLWIFGGNVEDRIGSVPYLAFYLLSGAAAAIGQGLIAPAPMVGASGAVAGVLGAYLVLYPGARIRTLIFLGIFITVVELPALLVIGLWIVLQALSGLAEVRMAAHPVTGQVAFFAHVVGFVTGIALLLAVFRRRRDRTRLRYA